MVLEIGLFDDKLDDVFLHDSSHLVVGRSVEYMLCEWR